MIRHIFKIIWNERKSNGWLVLEYILVFCILWFCCDYLYFITKRLVEPLGYDIKYVYQLNMGMRFDKEFLANFDEEAQPSPHDMTMQLIDRLKRYPGVENVSVSSCALPFERGSSETSGPVMPGDSVHARAWMGYVSREFFEVFKTDILKGDISNWPDPAFPNQAFITSVPHEKFGNYNVFDLHVIFASPKPEDDSGYQVTGVAGKMKRFAYNAYIPAVLQPIKYGHLDWGEVALRVSPGADRGFAERFAKDMKDQLNLGRYFFSSIVPLSKYRYEYRGVGNDPIKDCKNVYIVSGFLLVNIFLGIIGTFWFRTQARRSEVGLRIAMGASKRKVKGMLITESMLLLSISALAGVIICLNIGQTDLTDMLGIPVPYRESYEMTPWNNVINFGITFLFLAIVSIAGVWYPARRASGVQPAEALHDE